MLRWILVLALALVSCGCGKGANAGGEKKGDLDGDPLALLPASAVVVVNLDARAIFESDSVGAQVAAIASKLVPLGEDTGFQASRDVDRVVIAGYATGGVDISAVLRGRFDPAKIAAATTATNGAQIVRSVYAGRQTYGVENVEYAVLSPKTVVAGSGQGLRRVLDRIQSGTFEPSIPPWAVETLESLKSGGAQIAGIADFETQPIAAATIGSLRLPWLEGMRVARVIGNFGPPGMNVAATLTYGDPQQAQNAAGGVRSVEGWLKMLGPLLGGVRLQNLDVTTDMKDLRCKFAVDDHTLRTALAIAPRLLPGFQ